jgi:integron integrase
MICATVVPIRSPLPHPLSPKRGEGSQKNADERIVVCPRYSPSSPLLPFNTEKAYVQKVRAFMADRGLKTLTDFERIGSSDVEAHLTDLAVDGDVAPSTQDQAFYALLFLFEHVLKRDFGSINAIRSSKAARIPTVMSKPEVIRVLSFLNGVYVLIAQLLYGCGMRISECLRLRVKDIDFDQLLIEIHNSKGDKSRFVPLPRQLVEPLRKLVESRRLVHEQDVANGEASVWLPHALDRKYPSAHAEFKWQFLFASARFSQDPKTGKLVRWID